MTTFFILTCFKHSVGVLGHDIAKSLAKINTCMSSLATLQAGFTFPDHIDIVDQYGSTKEPLDLLPHTRNNKYLLRYLMALQDLRGELGTVESFNDSNVRKSRSLAIGRVEEVLQYVRDEVAKRFNQSQPLRSKNKIVQSRSEKFDRIQCT